MTNAADWQGAVGRNWASEWRRTDRSFAALNAILVERIAAKAPPAARILDIGCGAGATSFALAERLPKASIIGIDLSPELIAAATARNHGRQIRFALRDATLWDGGAWRPDLLVSRHGVMFFDDPVSAFAHLARAAAPGAQLIFSCFRDRAENEWAQKLLALLPDAPTLAPLASGPFAFADPDHVRGILSTAGWRDASPEPVDFTYVAGAGIDPVADAADFFTRIGPAAPLIRALDGEQRISVLDKLSEMLCNQLENRQVLFKAASWIWTARL